MQFNTVCLGCYITLSMAFMQATLRFTDDGYSAFFRIISPVLVAVILYKDIRPYREVIFGTAGLFLYSIIISFLFYGNIAWKMYAFFMYNIIEYIIIKYLYLNDNNWKENFYNFLDIFTTIVILLCLFQYATGYIFPHIPIRNGELTVFWGNGNELSEPIICVGIIYIYRSLYTKNTSILKMILIFIIANYNDAKLSLIGFFVSFIILLVYKIFSYKLNSIKLSGGVVATAGLSILAIMLFYFSTSNVSIPFWRYNYSFNELLGDVFEHIIKLQPFPGVGSMQVRANAIIYGLQELGKTGYLGIGFGNSYLMLTQEEYVMKGVMSMHNILAQFITEFGIFSIYILSKIVMNIIKGIRNVHKNSENILYVSFFIGFVFISSQSSGGLANYMVWAVVIYVLLLNEMNIKGNVRYY